MKKMFFVQVRLSGLGTEKLLNEARKRGIGLESVRREENRCVTVRCAARDEEKLRALAKEKGYAAGPARPVGALRAARALKKRWGLLLGAGIAAALAAYAMGFVWRVDIENAGAYAGEVRAFLAERGVFPGLRRDAIDLNRLREQLEWRLPKVKWVRTEFSGVALRVRLEEGTPPPDADAAGPGDVIAGEDGLLLRLTTFSGTPQAKAGDFVRAGQVLIRGEERGKNGEMIPVKARGEAQARLWVQVQARLPLQETLSLPTGRMDTRRVIQTPFFSWTGKETPDFLTCDTEIISLPLGGAWLPVTLKREIFLEAALEKRQREMEEVKREGAEAALRMLRELVNPQETVDKWINFSMIEGDTVAVTATAEIWRDIARYQKN